MDSKTEAGLLVIGVFLCIFFTRSLLGCGSDSKKKAEEKEQKNEAESKNSSLLLNTDKFELVRENGTCVVFSVA